MTDQPAPARFACDAMLGGLARWLRAAGPDATVQYGIEDRALVDLARSEGRIILSSDEPLARAIHARGLLPADAGRVPKPPVGPGPYPPALFVPRGMRKLDQLRYVLGRLGLPFLDPRCMACGGELVEIPREEARREVPPKVFQSMRVFGRCGRCGKLLWGGSHWRQISARLKEIQGKSGT